MLARGDFELTPKPYLENGLPFVFELTTMEKKDPKVWRFIEIYPH